MLKKLSFLSLVLFVFGNMTVLLGISKGKDIAISLARPTPTTNSWNTPESTINAVYYGFFSIGGTLVVISIILAVISLIYFIKNSTK